jgi:hypothetical protein
MRSYHYSSRQPGSTRKEFWNGRRTPMAISHNRCPGNFLLTKTR